MLTELAGLCLLIIAAMPDARLNSSTHDSRTAALFRAGSGLANDHDVTGITDASRGPVRPSTSMEMNIIPSVNLAEKVKRLSNEMQVSLIS